MKLALTTLAGTLVLAGCATSPKPDEHAGHHPGAASAAAPSASSPAQMGSMMKAMQEMHDKMAAAKTPEERAALMQEHMKLMREGMHMMQRMRGGGMGRGGMAMSPETMGQRMDMMEMMMQMMMDREGVKP